MEKQVIFLIFVIVLSAVSLGMAGKQRTSDFEGFIFFKELITLILAVCALLYNFYK